MAKTTPRILCIGAAVQDVFLEGKIFSAHKNKDSELVQEFDLGTKNEIDNVTISVGGGATNAAVTFARQGLHALYLGRVGDDTAGQIVLDMLHREAVDTSLVKTVTDIGTGYSAILLSPKGERTVLTYRGASQKYDLAEADFHQTRADWLYISSLSGDTSALKTAIEYAKNNDIAIAINPGKGEIEHVKQFRDLLKDFSILSLNREEMQSLFHKESIRDILIEATKYVSTVLLTDGPKGSYACDGTQIFKAGMYEDVEVIDRLGAGDAFTSGFVKVIAEGGSIPEALTFASANSTSVVIKIGAKTGILHESAKLHQMPIEVTRI